MSQANELLSVLTAGGNEKDHIVIGNDRFITVPDDLRKIAVQYDHDIETVTFDCPRYWDEHDLSTMRIYVNYMRPDGSLGMRLCTNVVADGDILHFDWTISGHVTEFAGNISFLVCIKTVDDDNVETNHWNSELNTDMYISEGMKCQETVLRRHPDIIAQLLTMLENTVDYMNTTKSLHDVVVEKAAQVASDNENVNTKHAEIKNFEENLDEIATQKARERVDEVLDNAIDNKLAVINANMDCATVTLLASGWTTEIPYTQTVAVEDITADWVPGNPVKHANEDNAVDAEEIKAAGFINRIDSGDGSLTFYCYKKLPTVDFTIDIPQIIGRSV